LDEALGMRRVGGEARVMPGLEDRRRTAVMYVGRRQIPQATVMVRLVVPPEQRMADRARILDRAEAIGKFRPDLNVRNCASENGLSLLTRGREWLVAIPRSAKSSATSLLRIGAPRSAWIVSWFGAMRCFSHVAAIRRSASRALSWAATSRRRSG
jgi:hypothetical protein